MPRIVDALVRRQIRVARTSSFDLHRPDAELRRLADLGAVLALAKGFYALVPESRRGVATPWRPTIEGAGLGMAAALYGPDLVALTGPSAARAHNCYPRALGEVYVAVPNQLRRRRTVVGDVRFVKRDIARLDTVRIETDLGTGWAASAEQTALDLCRNRPFWAITDEARNEVIRLLADKIDWGIIDDVAAETRSIATLQRLRTQLDRNDR